MQGLLHERQAGRACPLVWSAETAAADPSVETAIRHAFQLRSTFMRRKFHGLQAAWAFWAFFPGGLFRFLGFQGLGFRGCHARAWVSLTSSWSMSGMPSPLMALVGTMLTYLRGSGFFQYSATFSPCARQGILVLQEAFQHSSKVKMHFHPAQKDASCAHADG